MVNRALRIGASAQPSWLAAMTATKKLYSLGPANTDIAARALFTPLSELPWAFGSDPATGDPASQILAGWNDSIDASDILKLIYFGAGEGYWGNYSLAWDILAARLEVWQDNHFCTTLAQAISEDADAYFSPTDAALMDDSLEISLSDNPVVTAAWQAAWIGAGKPFPVKCQGWVIRRKLSSYTHGNNRHYAGRYDVVEYVKASLTGTGKGAIVVNGNSWRGPWGAGPTPPSGDTANWNESVDSGNSPRSWLFWQDVNLDGTPGAWHRSTDRIPEGVPSGVWNSAAFLDEAAKRIYYLNYGPVFLGLYYYDFSSGMASGTWSSLTTLTSSGTDYGPQGERSTWAHTLNTHPTGGRYAFTKASALSDGTRDNALVCIDFATGRYVQLASIPGLAIDESGVSTPENVLEKGLNVSICYDETVGTYGAIRMVSTSEIRGARLHTVPLPEDPTSAANYSGVTNETLTLDTGLSLDTTGANVNFKRYGAGKGGKVLEMDSKRLLILNQNKGPLLAVRLT